MKSAIRPWHYLFSEFSFREEKHTFTQLRQIFRESQSVMDFRKASMSLKWIYAHRSFAENNKKKKKKVD